MLGFLKRKPTAHIGEILVSEEALSDKAETYDAVQDVVDFTNAAMHTALLNESEFPVEATQIYQADYYVAQVKNGGHSQYLSNGAQNFAFMDHALAALKMIGCLPYAACLRDLQDGARAKPQ